MVARRFLAIVVGLSVCASLASEAAAQDFFPWITRPYRFLPRLSELTKTGGIAGIHEEYYIRGTFDFQITQSPLAVYPPIYLAKFDDVDAAGIHPIKDEVIDLNFAFNLEELQGSTGFRGPRNVFRFRGEVEHETDVKSKVELHATVLGPWLLVRGGTKPPANAADMFQYRIRAVARTRPLADFNEDGVVDAGDLRAWTERPDRNGGDLLEWQRQLGEQPPVAEMDAAIDAAIAAAAASGASAVPEPASAALVIAGGWGLLAARRRRHG